MRYNRLKVLLSGLLILATVTIGCAKQPPVVSHGGPVIDYVSLVDNLRAKGAAVVPAGEVSQDFLSVTGNAITVNGENVQVFEYSDARIANSEADTISPDGSQITTKDGRVVMVDWIAPPHWYKKEKLIVLYVGDDAGVISLLTEVLGKQFAGG